VRQAQLPQRGGNLGWVFCGVLGSARCRLFLRRYTQIMLPYHPYHSSFKSFPHLSMLPAVRLDLLIKRRPKRSYPSVACRY
jgi:hypothetical protein